MTSLFLNFLPTSQKMPDILADVSKNWLKMPT